MCGLGSTCKCKIYTEFFLNSFKSVLSGGDNQRVQFYENFHQFLIWISTQDVTNVSTGMWDDHQNKW